MQSYTFLLAATAVSASDLPTCACHAEALGFEIDCTATSVIQTAYDALKANCLTDCSSTTCKKDFAIVESHHDFCLHDQVPKEVEVGFHDLEEVCEKECSIGRLRDPDHKVCEAYTCPEYGFQTEEVITELATNGCDTSCPEATCGLAFRKLRVIHDECPAADDKAFEWAGVFPIADASHTWSMQKVDGAYADPAMKVVFIPTTTPTQAKLEDLENVGSNLLIHECTVVNDGGSMTPAADGSCFQLTVDASKDDSTFTLNTDGLSGLAIYCEHVPIEFERDTHYLYDSSSVDIEPAGQLTPSAFEWAGVFATSDSSHTWSMQKVDGAYADPAMKVVFIPTTAPTEATLESLAYTGSNFILEFDTACTVVNDGGSMTPAAGGSCFDLTVDASKDDSTFTINTDGISGLAIYAQHVPTEFERDTHYLFDSSSVDIEPIAEMGGGGHAGHDHGHRRLVDVDAALHTYEDACDAVGCYIEAAGCSAGAVDLTSLDTLQDRASKKCHVTEEEATTCPSSSDTADESGVKPVTVLAGVALVLTATMN